MSCSVRLIRREDIAQVTEISREAFPTEWPPRNYQHELQNQSARYIVACDDEKVVEQLEVKAYPEEVPRGLASKVKRFFTHGYLSGSKLPPSGSQYIVGFAGLWVMADEAHITDIAVREVYRQQGIGELLLISTIDLVTELNVCIIALEVRVSNTAAQRLYSKYGFTQVGVRRGYYTDNKEDAILMSTENITSASFQAHLQQLKQDHFQKWGIASINLSASQQLTGNSTSQPGRR